MADAALRTGTGCPDAAPDPMTFGHVTATSTSAAVVIRIRHRGPTRAAISAPLASPNSRANTLSVVIAGEASPMSGSRVRPTAPPTRNNVKGAGRGPYRTGPDLIRTGLTTLRPAQSEAPIRAHKRREEAIAEAARNHGIGSDQAPRSGEHPEQIARPDRRVDGRVVLLAADVAPGHPSLGTRSPNTSVNYKSDRSGYILRPFDCIEMRNVPSCAPRPAVLGD